MPSARKVPSSFTAQFSVLPENFSWEEGTYKRPKRSVKKHDNIVQQYASHASLMTLQMQTLRADFAIRSTTAERSVNLLPFVATAGVRASVAAACAAVRAPAARQRNDAASKAL